MSSEYIAAILEVTMSDESGSIMTNHHDFTMSLICRLYMLLLLETSIIKKSFGYISKASYAS